MIRRSLVLIALLCIGLAAPAAGEVEPGLKPDIAVFDEVWRTVDRHFYDPEFRGQDWDAVRDKYRPLAEAAPDADAQAKIIDRMLAELGASHTGRYRQDDPAYYQLLDIFSGSLRRELRTLFPNGVRYPGIGMFTRDDRRQAVRVRHHRRPARRQGRHAGGRRNHRRRRQAVRAGRLVRRQGRPDGDACMSAAQPAAPPCRSRSSRVWIEPGEAFESAMSDGARIIEADGKKIGYVRDLVVCRRPLPGACSRKCCSTGKLKDADALIWDLRDGWGGARLITSNLQQARPDHGVDRPRRRSGAWST